MNEFEILSQEELAELTPEQLEEYQKDFDSFVFKYSNMRVEEVTALSEEGKQSYDIVQEYLKSQEETSASHLTEDDRKYLETLGIEELRAEALKRGYRFPNNIGIVKLLARMEEPPKTENGDPEISVNQDEASEEVVKKPTAWETADGTQFPLFNDANNYALELGGEYVEPKEVEID